MTPQILHLIRFLWSVGGGSGSIIIHEEVEYCTYCMHVPVLHTQAVHLSCFSSLHLRLQLG